MIQEPIWNLWSNTSRFDELKKDIVVDVAIIGGGITGIQTAVKLKETGLKIAVLEARSIAKGTTGQSTGNLYEITEDLFTTLADKYDTETLTKLHASRRDAMQAIFQTIRRHDLSCDYHSRAMYLMEDGVSSTLQKEQGMAKKMGMELGAGDDFSFSFPITKSLKLSDQAQFNPLLYTTQLAQKLATGDVLLYENTPAESISEKKKEFKVRTPKATITAKYVVHATHTPKGKELEYHSVLGPCREFGIAAKLKDTSLPDGIFWYYSQEGKKSFRKYTRGNDCYLIVVGKEYKVGQVENEKEKLKKLDNFSHQYFDIDKTLYCWGGQNYKPADHIPYIGETHEGSREYIATGFGPDGLVYGVLAADIIAAAISGSSHRYNDLFKAHRHQPLKAAKRFIKENKDTAAHFISHLVISRDDLENLAPGSGEVFNLEEGRVAVYKHPSGTVHKMNAVCPHMGCVVAWNDLEKSWDCPCHGSRFNRMGKYIEGPSWKNMEYLGRENQNEK